jgi:alginate O-acetyltransferase complex protein AlgI
VVFSSSVFLVYFLPVFLILYYLSDKKYKNFVLLFSSIFFYSWGAPKFVFVIIGTTLLDFFLVRAMGRSERRWKRRAYLTASVCINVGLLFYFKYSNFFIENVNFLFGHLGLHTVKWAKLLLPIGISFYTFETITYVVDVYRGVHKPLNNFWEYQLYIILFPKLIAGPIIRYHQIADQITDRTKNETWDNRLTGFYRFIIGLSKKVIIANTMGEMADDIFGLDINSVSTPTAWIGILAYTFQIYFDFSGYSDMAIGIARMVGFIFPENFNNPYTSQSITEFWRRWHITLGTWMKNYLYIPLGGNRVKTKRRLFFNLWLVFILSGLWHGASWNFIIWGAYNGLFLILDRMFLVKALNYLNKPLRVLLTFLIVVIGWIFFRTEHFHDAILFIHKLFAFDFSPVHDLSTKFIFILSLAILFSFFTVPTIGQTIQDIIYGTYHISSRHLAFAFASLVLFIVCLGAVTTSNFNPFIYFRF